MSAPVSKRKVAWVLAGLISAFILPAVLTLMTVEEPRPFVPVHDNPTPYGYTVSLSLFLVPALVLGIWYKYAPLDSLTRKGFLWTLLLLPPLGFLLDFLFGHLFFTFVNKDATLGILIPVLGGESVPVEEVVFYVSGVAAALLLYLWTDWYWLKAYQVPFDEQEIARRGVDRVIRLHWPSFIIGAAAVLVAVAFKKCCSEAPEGFPGYFTFLVFLAVAPSMVLYPTAAPFINWRALSFTYFVLLFVSLLWEATLGVPYQWWGYKNEQMLGIFVDAWANLPAEEPTLWMTISFTTIIAYQSIKVFIALKANRRLKEALLGPSRN